MVQRSRFCHLKKYLLMWPPLTAVLAMESSGTGVTCYSTTLPAPSGHRGKRRRLSARHFFPKWRNTQWHLPERTDDLKPLVLQGKIGQRGDEQAAHQTPCSWHPPSSCSRDLGGLSQPWAEPPGLLWSCLYNASFVPVAHGKHQVGWARPGNF